MPETVYVTIKYDFFPDVPPINELSEGVEDIEVGVFLTLETAKRSIETQYSKFQEEYRDLFDEDQDKIKWIDHEDHSFQNDFGGEVIIRKMTINAET